MQCAFDILSTNEHFIDIMTMTLTLLMTLERPVVYYTILFARELVTTLRMI
jgi:hypothetical protein